MTSIIIEVEGLADIRKLLKGEPQNQAEAMIKAQNDVASLAVEEIQRGLNIRGGAEPKQGQPRPKDYRNSKKGEMPLMHSGRLRDSIYFKNKVHKTTVETKIGSLINTPEYAKYLEGRKGDGIRPFLWYARKQKVFTSDNVLKYFDKYYKPLQDIR